MNFLPYILLFVVIFGSYFYVNRLSSKINNIDYNKLTIELESNNVKELNVTPKNSSGIYVITGKLNSYAKNESFKLSVPLTDTLISSIYDKAKENNLEVTTNSNPENSLWLNILINVVPILMIGGLLYYTFVKLGSNGKGTFDFGKSRAKLSEEGGTKTFKDVAGLVEEKEEVQELIDFLRNPKKFTKMGARIPKGVLLVGPPGTGKTLLAKAVAGEAKVPFFYISGSDFVELFVGVGASRVRDMFKQAKQTAPCLIFIDEIDAVGRERGTGLGGGHDEREQTLNQLLSEMDGFGENEGIIIIAATNRPDVLDPALLRPGRFDRQVTVDLPDVREREAILKVHAKNKILAPSVKLEYLAKRTPGFSGAGLENLLNEAALLAVRRNKSAITMSEIDEATDRVIAGPAKISRKYTDREKKVVAYHEAGHAVIGIKLSHADIVQKITIIPRGNAGGYNLMMPSEETYLSTKTELLERITGLLGGRTSEELEFNEVTTGAHNDFEKATKIARAMVTEYGMSNLGLVQLEQQEGGVFLGRDYNKSRNFSNEMAHEIDEEVRKIMDDCHKKAKEILTKNKNLVKLIADALLEYETLTKEEIDSLVETGHMPEEDNSKKEEVETKKTSKKEEVKENE
ncbi:MAG: ATP-dependent zinc metalloprotease FtsH [Bacilli bacterium]|nr:ATP-dependent zinc metalloprotease FtsH [Bacilli bacterium]